MIAQAAVVLGALFAVSFYLLLSPNMQRAAMGILVLTNAVNLMVITASGLLPGTQPPVLGHGKTPVADPLPHAFLLTAIVIGLGAAAFVLALAARTHAEIGSDELAHPDSHAPPP